MRAGTPESVGTPASFAPTPKVAVCAGVWPSAQAEAPKVCQVDPPGATARPDSRWEEAGGAVA